MESGKSAPNSYSAAVARVRAFLEYQTKVTGENEIIMYDRGMDERPLLASDLRILCDALDATPGSNSKEKA